LQEGANEEKQEKSVSHKVMLMGIDREESEDVSVRMA
jgi:hypothetical protein